MISLLRRTAVTVVFENQNESQRVKAHSASVLGEVPGILPSFLVA